MDNSVIIKTQEDLKLLLAKNYQSQIENFFGDKKQALKFLSSVMAAVQRNPKLLECTPTSLINSFIMMAQLQLMPSDVSGQAYVLPYKNKGVMEAQFQLGYQGLITLFYRAGGTQVRAEIVRERDVFSFKNGKVEHEIDIMKSNEARGRAVGAYAIATLNGHEIAKVMNEVDILKFGQEFSKSYYEYDYKAKQTTDRISEHTPWNEKNDPELNMWKKTVLKQLGKYLPKDDRINLAIAEDNKDSVMHDRIEAAKQESEGMKMGALVQAGGPIDSIESPVVGQVIAADPVYEPIVTEPAETPKVMATVKPKSAAGEAMKRGMEAGVAGQPAPVSDQCPDCGGHISEPEKVFSQKKYGRILCRPCQK